MGDNVKKKDRFNWTNIGRLKNGKDIFGNPT